MTPTSTRARLLLAGVLLAASASTTSAQVRLADESDRAAFRSWFVLLADAQFERQAADVTDCAALVRHAVPRSAARPHAGMGPPYRAPLHAAIRRRASRRRAPRPRGGRCSASATPTPARFAEFADAKTLIALNSVPLGRDISRARPGDLLYFQQPGQRNPIT